MAKKYKSPLSAVSGAFDEKRKETSMQADFRQRANAAKEEQEKQSQSFFAMRDNLMSGSTQKKSNPSDFFSMRQQLMSGGNSATSFEDFRNNLLGISGNQQQGNDVNIFTQEREERERQNQMRYGGMFGMEQYRGDTEAAKAEQEATPWWKEAIQNMALAGDGSPVDNFTIVRRQYEKDNSYREPQKDWTQDELNEFGYYFRQDKEKAYQFAEAVNQKHIQQQNAEAQTKAEQFGKDHKLGTFAANVGSSVSGLGLGEFMNQAIEYSVRGKTADSNVMGLSSMADAAMGGAAADINEKGVHIGKLNLGTTFNEDIPIIGGKGWGDAYQLANSIVTSMISAHTLGAATDIAFFGNAAESAYRDAQKRGATDEQALAMGALSGTAEAMFEHISIEKLLSTEAADTMKAFFRNIGRQMLAEGSEEISTSIFNNLADQFVMKDKSNFYQLVNEYKWANPDASDKEAQKAAWIQMAQDLAFDFIGGTISGGVSGALETGGKTIYQHQFVDPSYKQSYGGVQNELVTEALDINPDNRVAQKAQERLGKGKDLSGTTLRQLVQGNDATVLRNAISERLTDMGETADINKLTEIIAKAAEGQELSLLEENAIKRSSIGEVVMREAESGELFDRYYAKHDMGSDVETHNVETETAQQTGNAEQKPQQTEQTARQAEQAEQADIPGKQEAKPTAAQEPVSQDAEAAQEEDSTPARTIEEVAKGYGEQSKAVQAVFNMGGNDQKDVGKFAFAFDSAYQMGASGVPKSYLNQQSVSYLTKDQAETAYSIGRDASNKAAVSRRAEIGKDANGKKGWKKGSVQGVGVSISEMTTRFNDQQKRAFRFLTDVANVTGLDIVLYDSKANEQGKFTDAQGKFEWKDNKLYIDINAGLSSVKNVGDLQKYTMVRSFAHEFTHFIERFSPEMYNELREVVFQRMEQNGENVDDLISRKMMEYGDISYEAASREVISEAMTDILPETSFIQELANEHKSLFDKFVDKLKEFVENLREYYKGLQKGTREAAAAKQQMGDTLKYFEDIVQKFDAAAKNAVESYQTTVAVDEDNSTTEAEVSTEDKADSTEIDTDSTENVEKAEEKAEEAASGNEMPVAESEAEEPTPVQEATVSEKETVQEAPKEEPKSGILFGKNGYRYPVYMTETTRMIGQLIETAKGIDSKITAWESALAETKADMAAQEKLMAQPFEHMEELTRVRDRYEEVMEQLNPKNEQIMGDDEGEVQEQKRTSNGFSDWEVLDMAAHKLDGLKLEDDQQLALDGFIRNLSSLERMVKDREDLGTQYREYQFGKNGVKVDRKAAEEVRQKMAPLDAQIEDARNKLLEMQNGAVLRRVLSQARGIVEKTERAAGEEKLRKWRDKRQNAEAIKKYRKRIIKDAKDMMDWAAHPSGKEALKHIPDALKGTVIPFLEHIDTSSKQLLRGGDPTQSDMEFARRLNALRNAASVNGDGGRFGLDKFASGLVDISPETLQAISNLADAVNAYAAAHTGEYVLNQMTSQELKELSKVTASMKKMIKEFNSFRSNRMFAHVFEAGDNSIDTLSKMEDDRSRTKVGETINNELFWDMIRPAEAWERFGDGGKSIYQSFVDGQARQAFSARHIIDFTEKAYTAKEVSDWAKQIINVNINGRNVSMKATQAMSFYLLCKRGQAMTHITGHGIRVATFRDGKYKYADAGGALSADAISAINDSLTDRQKEVADKLQKFMAEYGGKLGNEVSRVRWGEDQFTEENYFPINTDGRYLAATADEMPGTASLYALLNMGFTKELTPKANNRIILYDVFDVFANHMASMSQYNAFALPVLDAMKWFNYQNDDSSLRDQLARVYGVAEETRPGSGSKSYAENFILGMIRAYNGTEAQGGTDGFGMNALHRANMTRVAYNVRVVVQQPMSIIRAANVIDPKYLFRALSLNPASVKRNVEEMRTRSGIGAWKDLGFYDTNISRGLTSLIKHDDSFMDKVGEWGMWGAEKADSITWGTMWAAAKEQAISEGYKYGTDKMWERTNDIFNEAIYKTQVVDSVMTKSAFLRRKDFFSRSVGSFMGEPMTTASMVLSVYDKFRREVQSGASVQEAARKHAKNIARLAAVYAVSSIIMSAAQAAIDAFRDDDEYETRPEKWWEAFKGNLLDELMPFNKLPIMSDLYDAAKEMLSIFGVDTYGNDPQTLYMHGFNAFRDGTKIIWDKLHGNENRKTWYAGIYKLLDGASVTFGIPGASIVRTGVNAWNATVGTYIDKDLYLRKYDAGSEGNVKYAYLDGYLTEEEAIRELVKNGDAKNDDDAYFKVHKWGTGDSKTDALEKALQSGSDIQTEIKVLKDHGYSDKQIVSSVKSLVKSLYVEGDLTAQAAADRLKKYADMDSRDASELITKWNSEKDTGISYSNISSEFIDGNLTEKEAVSMMMKYGGVKREDAEEAIQKAKCEKETGIPYNDVKSYYIKGKISEQKAVELLVKYGGVKPEDAAEQILKAQMEKDTGYKYSDIRDEYESGNITEHQAAQYYQVYGGKSEEDAREAAELLAFRVAHPGTDSMTYNAMTLYNQHIASTGLRASDYNLIYKDLNNLTSDKYDSGKTIRGSLEQKRIAYIESLNITAAQKDAIYISMGYAAWKAWQMPWH